MNVRTHALACATTLALVLSACGDDANNDINGNDAAVASDGGTRDASAEDATTSLDAEAADANVAIDLGPDAFVDPTPDEVGFDELPATLASAWCARPTCFDGPDVDSFVAAMFRVTPSGIACTDRVTNYFALLLTGVREPAEWDGVAAKACVDYIRSEGTCEELFDAECFGNLDEDDGLVAEGGACTSAYSCDVGLACDKGGATDYRCEGTCEPGKPLGASCMNNDECARTAIEDSSYCSPPPGSFSGGICLRDTYTYEGDVGDDCDVTSYDETTFTRTNIYCRSGLRCTDNVCREEPRGAGGLGDTCDNEGDESERCERRFECLPAEGGGTTCQYLPITTTAGAPCGIVDGVPVFCDYFAGFACSFASGDAESGTCVAVGDGSLGSTCMFVESFAKSSTCDGDLRCAGIGEEDFISAGTCAARLADDELCSGNEDCVSDYCKYIGCGDEGCEYRCATRRTVEDGGACQSDDDCMSGACQSICGVDGCENICITLECSPPG